MAPRDNRWILTKGHWYWLQAIRWCDDDCDGSGFTDGGHWCGETLWAREQHSSTKVEINPDVSKLRERGGIAEPALVAAREWGWPADNDPTTPSTASEANLSRSHTNTTGNP